MKVRYQKSPELINLEKLYHQWYYNVRDGGKYSSIPERIRTVKRFSDKDANSLTSAIKAWFECHGGIMSRINTTGIYDQRLQRYRYSGSTRGVSDLVGIYEGKSISIEVEFGADRMSTQQLEYKRNVEVAGGIFYEAHNFKDFIGWFYQTFGGEQPC